MQTVLEDDRLEDDRLEDEGENSAELILLLHLLACTNHLTLWAQMYALLEVLHYSHQPVQEPDLSSW